MPPISQEGHNFYKTQAKNNIFPPKFQKVRIEKFQKVNEFLKDL